MNLQHEIQIIAARLRPTSPEDAQRLCNIASRVGRLELMVDDICADAQQAERARTDALTARPPVVFDLRRLRRGAAR